MAIRLFAVDGGGVSRLVKTARLFVIDSGATARKLKRLFVIDGGGVARQVYQGATYSVGVDVGNSNPNFCVADIAYHSDGTIWGCAGNGNPTSEGINWVTPTSLAPGAYTVRAHINSSSGTAPSGSAFDTDLALTSNRDWGMTQAPAGTSTANLTITIKDGGGNTVVTGTIVLTAQAT